MRANLIVIFQVRQQYVTKMPLSEHNSVVKAFASDRTDQPFGTPILPRGAWRRWSVANAHRSKSSDENVAIDVPVVNQIRTYWWCSPPRTGRQRMVPASSTARETGASFSKDKCVLISL